MPGDFSRFSDNAKNRFSALYMQQGRVQLDADWNESVEIVRRRARDQARDFFGPAAVPRATTPNGFEIGFVGAPSLDITIAPGRIYVDGILAEYFSDETFTYSTQPFLPNPPPLSTLGSSVLVYLDVWTREITAVEDGTLVDPALNGVDTGTRLKTIWQVKAIAGTACVSDFSQLFPPSGGRLTTSLDPSTPAVDPCSLPSAGGYQGVDNRLYRVEVHDVTNPTNPLFKWSRDNGSVATTATALTNQAALATIVVSTLGRDDDLSFHVNDWIEVTDDLHELNGQAGLMAQITVIDAANRVLTVDRSLAAGNFDAQGANRLRIRRWDQSTTLSGSTGLAAAGTAPVALENGILVQLAALPGTSFNVGDAWVFAARTSNGSFDMLSSAPPIAIEHHYCALGTIQGLGGAAPMVTDCRVLVGAECGCTECVSAEQHNSGAYTIQEAIDRLTTQGGGVVCLGPGTFNITTGISISSVFVGTGDESGNFFPGNIELRGSGPATVLLAQVPATISVNNADGIRIVDLTLNCSPPPATTPPALTVGVNLINVNNFSIERCSITVYAAGFGVALNVVSAVYTGLACNNSFSGDYAIGTFNVDDSIPASPSNDTGSAYLYDFIIRDNMLFGGIAFFGSSNLFSGTIIENNFIQADGQPGIAVYGVTSNSFPLRISNNQIMLYGFSGTVQGIYLGCDDAIVIENTIYIYGPSTIGIYIGEPPMLGQIRSTVERNRVTGSPFFAGTTGIYFDASASRVTIRHNTVLSTDIGVYTSLTAAADDLVIEGNEFLNIGAGSTAATPLHYGFVGIVATDATRLIVRDNTMSNVGTSATSASTNQIAGVLVAESMATPAASVVITGNEMKNIGSSLSTAALAAPPVILPMTFGVVVTGTFDRARVSHNRVNFQHTGRPLSFAGISLIGTSNNLPGQQDVEVSSNMIDAVMSSTALVNINVVGSCMLRANSVATLGSPTNSATSPLSGTPNEIGITVVANTLIATDNQVNVYGVFTSPASGWGMQLTVTRVVPGNNTPSVVILGNICSTGIALAWTGASGVFQSLASITSPWLSLNVIT